MPNLTPKQMAQQDAGSDPNGNAINVYKPKYKNNNTPDARPVPLPTRGNGGRPSPGGTITARATAASNAAKAAAKSKAAAKTAASKKAAKNKTTNTTPTVPAATPAPPVSSLTVEDQALQGNYDPSTIQNPGYGKAGTGGTDLASQFDPATFAKSMAGQQYDPGVTQLATRIKGIVNALPGSLDSLQKAFANIDMANNARQGVVGGPTTAAAGALQNATIAGNNAQADNQNLATDTREADWAQRIKLLSGANVNDMRGQLQGLTQQRADAVQAYTQQGIKTKSDLVSQAIANINSMRASNTSAALAGGMLEGQGLKNQAQSLANQSAQQQNLYTPYLENSNLTTAGQTQTMNTMSIQKATESLKQLAPAKTLAEARQKGGEDALKSMIIPPNGITVNTNGYSNVRGDPNIWLKTGVKNIMTRLPNSNRANVTAYVKNQIEQAISTAGGWKTKNGKFVRPK